METKSRLAIAYLGILASATYLIVSAAFIATSSPAFLAGMEIVTILSAPVFLLVIESLLQDCPKSKIFLKQLAIIFMSSCMILTVSAHFINLTVTGPLMDRGIDVPKYFQIGQWPSVEMAIDYLAWGFFMGLAFICSSLAISGEPHTRRLKTTTFACGCLCLAGLMGPVSGKEAIWLLAVIGYGIGTPLICMEMIRLGKKSERFSST